jgi:hypothetical protein
MHSTINITQNGRVWISLPSSPGDLMAQLSALGDNIMPGLKAHQFETAIPQISRTAYVIFNSSRTSGISAIMWTRPLPSSLAAGCRITSKLIASQSAMVFCPHTTHTGLRRMALWHCLKTTNWLTLCETGIHRLYMGKAKQEAWNWHEQGC